jgi:DNA-binding PadR family transcriptional regulator
MLQYILLGLLNYAPMTGYELKSIIDESTTHFWHAHHSQIYTMLRKLEAEGMLVSEESDGDDKLKRRVYELTEAGRNVLLDWLSKPLLEVPTVKEDLLVRLFFSSQRDPQDVLDELRFQRQLHEQKLEAFRALGAGHMKKRMGLNDETLAQNAVFWMLTLQFGISYEQMYLRWLDDAIAQISGL